MRHPRELATFRIECTSDTFVTIRDMSIDEALRLPPCEHHIFLVQGRAVVEGAGYSSTTLDAHHDDIKVVKAETLRVRALDANTALRITIK